MSTSRISATVHLGNVSVDIHLGADAEITAMLLAHGRPECGTAKGEQTGQRIKKHLRIFDCVHLWYNIIMKCAAMNETSNQEMITISRAEYEAMPAQLAKQNQQLETKSA